MAVGSVIQKGGKDPDYDTIFADDSDQDILRGAAEIYSIFGVSGDWGSLGGLPRRSEWPGLGGLEQTLQPVRSQDTSKVADGHDGCHDTEKSQGCERADQRGGGLGGEGEESQDGARHRLGSAHQGGIVDRDVASGFVGLRV